MQNLAPLHTDLSADRLPTRRRFSSAVARIYGKAITMALETP
jgi:hypothetical protein